MLHKEPKPDLIVFTMFNERPVLRHRKYNYNISLDNTSINQCNDQQRKWLLEEFEPVELNHDTYLDRFEEMLLMTRQRYPDVPMVVVQRLSHFPAFGPNPSSLLENWDNDWKNSYSFVQNLMAKFPRLYIICMDAVVREFCIHNNIRIDTISSFMKYEFTNNDGDTTLRMIRDIDHAGQMIWDTVAQKIVTLCKSAQITYNNKSMPAEWFMSDYKPPHISPQMIISLLSTGDNYNTARAISYLIWDLKNDMTDLLVKYSECIPADQSVLHMIKTYASIWRNTHLEEFIDTHIEKARVMLQNREKGFIT